MGGRSNGARTTARWLPLLACALALGACGPAATTEPTLPPTQPPATAVPPPSAVPTTVPTVAPTTPPTVVITDPAQLIQRCQLTGYQIYQDKANNFCFAYTPRYHAVMNASGQPELQGPKTEPANQVTLGVEVKTVPAGSSLKALVDEVVATIPPDLLRRSPTTLGGEPAEQLEVSQGRAALQVLALHKDKLVRLTFSPLSYDEMNFLLNDFQSLYKPVTVSFTFLDGYTVPIASLRSDIPQICQVSASGLAISAADGYCYAYPRRFRMSKILDLYGPLLDASPEPLQVSLTVSVVQPPAGASLDKAVDTFLADATSGADLSTFPKITRTPLQLGGEAALLVEPVPGYGSARFVFALHNGSLYRLRFWPVDPSTGTHDLEELYQAVKASFSFIP